jgi:beta-N-acetylhexosaminidase
VRLRTFFERLAPRTRLRVALAAVAVAVVATVAVVVFVVGADDEKAGLPEGGSHFGAAPSASRSSSLVDALAPLLVGGAPESRPRKRGSGPVRPIDLPLDRAVAQLFAVGFRGTEPRAPFFEVLRHREYGAVLLGRSNYVDGPQLAALAGEVRVVAQNSGHAVPLIGARQAGGSYSSFPNLPPRAPPAVAASRKAAPVRDEARLAGGQLRALGLNLTIAPDADLAIAAGPAQDRGFSDDPVVAARLVKAAVEGYRRQHVAAAVGHFPGEGAAAQNPDVGPTSIGLTPEELEQHDLKPFAAVARTAPVIVMSNAAYVAFDGVTPATLLPDAVRLLRNRLHFRGVIMSSDLGAAAENLGESVSDAALDALRAGVDLLYVPGGLRDQQAAYDAVLTAARRGTIARRRIARSITRIQTVKRAFRLTATASTTGAGTVTTP